MYNIFIRCKKNEEMGKGEKKMETIEINATYRNEIVQIKIKKTKEKISAQYKGDGRAYDYQIIGLDYDRLLMTTCGSEGWAVIIDADTTKKLSYFFSRGNEEKR